MLTEQLKALQLRFNEERKKSDNWSHNNTIKINKTQNNTTVDPSGDPSSVPSYVPSVNPFIGPSEQQVGDINK